MRVMGLDLGSKTLGISMSDALKMIASPIETFRFESDAYDKAIEYVGVLIKKHEVSEIVLGLPKHMNGDVGIRGNISLDFKAKLEEKYHLPVILIDERMTTMSAQRFLISADVSRKKRKQVVDQIAAVSILQTYLDKKR